MDSERSGLSADEGARDQGARLDAPPASGFTAEEFRTYGRVLVDWIADYYANIEDYPVMSQVEPGAVRSMLPANAPESPESFDAILDDVNRVIMPGITHWQSPNFFAFFPANTSYPSILGEFLSAGLGVQGMSWATSPSCTELESHVLDWLVDLLDLPIAFKSTGEGGGVIQDSASSATLCAMLAARDAVLADASGKRLTAYASEEAHSSVSKAAGISGIGRDGLRTVACDDRRRIDVADLRRSVLADIESGHRPFFACATVGTTSTMAIDPVDAVGDLCREFGLWLHVDAAMAGSAAICPEFRAIHRGLDRADSYCFNPHKWLLTNFDCDCFFVRSRRHLLDALSILPEYLRTIATDSGHVIDYRDWQIPLGRRFRALKLWFTIRAYGASALREHIRRHVALATTFSQWVDEDPDFELVVPTRLNLVCFRHRGGDDSNRLLLDRVNESGRIYMTHTRVNGRFALRICIGQRTTTFKHVEAAWAVIRAAAGAVR